MPLFLLSRFIDLVYFLIAVPSNKHPSLYPTESIVYFSLPMTVSEKNVQKATLMIYIATPYGAEARNVNLCISDTRYRNKPFLNRTVTLSSRGHWEHIDVSQIVRDWAADEHQNYGLIVSALFHGKNIAYLNEDPLEVEKEKVVLHDDITSHPHRVSLLSY